jgi:glycogen synthase
MTPRVSVVVNTIDRADSLRRTLLSLLQLDYPELEVVVVVGPSTDHTDAVAAEFANTMKIVRCDTANLSVSRNLGIRHASGEIVAFIDDDAVPDPWWLDDIVPAFDDPEVAAVGGPVYDFDGSLFSTHSIADSHGDPRIATHGPNPTHILAAPHSDLFVTPIGTNSAFRRSAVVAVGGFDEEFKYFLDETEVCRRLVDDAWVVEACEQGFVHHLRVPSAVRTEERVTRNLYPVLRSRLYFAFRHALPRHGLREVMRRYDETVERYRTARRWEVENGLLERSDLEAFEQDAVRAVDDAMAAARRGPQTRPPSWFDEDGASFVALRRTLPARRLHICIVSHEYPPKPLNGIGRYSHELAVALADKGHVVRVLTEASDHDGVSFEGGVWVHRVLPRPATPPAGLETPSWIWNFSQRVLRELHRIDDARSVDVVHLPNWNSEGIAVLEEDRFTTVLGLHTPLETIARIEPSIDPHAAETLQLLSLERRSYERASAFVAWGPASLGQVEEAYGIELPPSRTGVVPHGIRDRRSSDPLTLSGQVNVLFVGRLESRKGADTFLEAVARLLPELPEVAFTLVGNDTIVSENGRTYREEFESATSARLRNGRVFFRGVVPDDELDRHYAGCDVFVAPSRRESFGLILLEAMREAKPVIAGDIGAMREIVEHDGNGLLVPAGDAEALAAAITRLAESPSLREQYGRRSRELFVEKFTAKRMAEGYERFFTSLLEEALAR